MSIARRVRCERRRLIGCVVLGVTLCAGRAVTWPSHAARAGAVPGFQVSGDPESPPGATWTYVATDGGVRYDLQGILLKPRGSGPFPAVIISHGMRGNAFGNPRVMAARMVSWGLVCIATNYTHATGVPPGSPGSTGEPGASQANVRRARKLLDILAGLGYVDMKRVAAHGHSMGAYVTEALVAACPSDFRAASHTAGGVRPPRIVAGPAASESQARAIRIPYQIHHGGADEVVPLAYDERFASILASSGVAHELFVYPGASHTDVILDPEVFARIRAWYTRWGVLPADPPARPDDVPLAPTSGSHSGSLPRR